MPISTHIIIKNLRGRSNFLCNCNCPTPTDFTLPQTASPSAKSLVSVLSLHPEDLCFCDGCGRNAEHENGRTLICMKPLIEMLNNQPGFICNCQCKMLPTDSSVSLEPSVEVLLKILRKNPENVCFCRGCDEHMNETIIPIQAEPRPFSRNNFMEQPVFNSIRKLRWILLFFAAIVFFYILYRASAKSEKSVSGELSTTMQSTTTQSTTKDDGIWNPI